MGFGITIVIFMNTVVEALHAIGLIAFYQGRP